MSRHLSAVSAPEPHGDNSGAGDGPGRHGPVEPGQEGTLAELQAENAELERELKAQRRRIATLLRLVEGQEDRRRETYIDAAREIYAYWREQCHPDAHDMAPGKKREKNIIARLAEGYSVAYIKRAIDGAKRAPNRSDHGEAYDDIELICREQPKLESFYRRAPKAAPSMQKWLGPQIDPYQ